MIRTLLLSAVALDEVLVINERHESTDSGVFNEGQIIYGENGEVIEEDRDILLIKPAIDGTSSEGVFTKNGEVIEEIVSVKLGIDVKLSEEAEDVVEENSDESDIDSKNDIRSELQELLKEEEAEMVKLSEEVEQTALEEERSQVKFEDDHCITNGTHHQNGHQISNPAGGLIGLNEDEEVELTTETEEITEEENGHTDTEKETELVTCTEQVSEENSVAMEEVTNTESGRPQEVKEDQVKLFDTEVPTEAETEKVPKLRRSAREKKPRNAAKSTTTTSAADLFKDMNLKTSLMEGHHHDVCSVDMYGKFIVSGGRDTSLKLWDGVENIELQSFGGHEGTITCVKFILDQTFENIPSVITASSDCSLRVWNMDEGKMTKSIYVYSSVTCLDYSNGLVAIGTEGGKVEVFNVESGDQQFTVNAFEGAITSSVKFLETTKVACGSAGGVIKLYNRTSSEDKTPIFTLEPETIKVSLKTEAISQDGGSSTGGLNMSRVNCMATWENLIIYGDNGYNIKVLNYQKGELTKVRNNLKEFCPTEALHIAQVQSKPYLFSVGSDVDNGDAYVNIRSLPDLQYLGTIRDIETNSGSVTSLCLQEIDKCIHFVTGGAQLRVWNQVVRRGRKRKGSPNGDPAYVPCKYICNFTDPRDSEPESDTETESESKSDASTEQTTERIPADTSNSWCNIL